MALLSGVLRSALVTEMMVEEFQKKDEGQQVYHLFNESQNKFIAECSDLVKRHVLGVGSMQVLCNNSRFHSRFLSC